MDLLRIEIITLIQMLYLHGIYRVLMKILIICRSNPPRVIKSNPNSKTGKCDLFTFEITLFSSSSEADFVDNKNASDSYQKQNEEKLDAQNPEDLDYSKFYHKLSSDEEHFIKNEDNIDILHEEIKSETGEDKIREGFCQMCYQNFGGETDIFVSTSYRYECSCQKQFDSLFYNVHGEDMTHDVKQTFELTPASELKLPEIKDETLPGDEVTEEQDLSAVPRRLSVSSVEKGNKIKHKLCSKPLENIQCKVCSKLFTCRNTLKIHERIHNTEKTFHCKVCSKSFSQTENLRVHERSHTGEKPFHCTICSKAFTSSGNMRAHKKIHTGEKPFKCEICSKAFITASKLRAHRRIHTGEKPFHCQVCSKAFISVSKARAHEKSHTGEKPYSCKICSKSFGRRDVLRAHERTHTGEKPYHCKICSKAFKNLSGLRSHGGFHCKVCSRSFSQMSNLRVHERVHLSEKEYRCKICSKVFGMSKTLKVHERIHTGEKSFHCKICSRAFTTSGQLKSHGKIHTM